MNGKNNFPPPGTRVIQLPPSALERLIGEGENKSQGYFDEVAKDENTRNSAYNAVVLAAIQHGGLPENPTEFYEKCAGIAEIVAKRQIEAKWAAVRDVYGHLGITDIRPANVFAARRSGIDLAKKD